MSSTGTIAGGSASGAARCRRQPGFTLVELMVTLAVVGILAAVAAPAMTSLINGNRLAGASGEMTASLQLARSEAIRRNARVTICATENGTTCSETTDWSSWIVVGRDNTAGVDEVLLSHDAGGAVQISGPAAGIEFRPSGLIEAAEALRICTPTAALTENRRNINVMISGSVTTTRSAGGPTCEG